VVGKDLNQYMQTLKPKGTKKKPLSFERLNILVLPIFKYIEFDKIKNQKTNKSENYEYLHNYVGFVKSHTNINKNTMFETMLNLYLVLGNETAMKSEVFSLMVEFLIENGQLQQVMIQQVKDIASLSQEWNLNAAQRVSLYFTCAQALEKVDDATGAFKVYYEAFKILNIQRKLDSKLY